MDIIPYSMVVSRSAKASNLRYGRKLGKWTWRMPLMPTTARHRQTDATDCSADSTVKCATSTPVVPHMDTVVMLKLVDPEPSYGHRASHLRSGLTLLIGAEVFNEKDLLPGVAAQSGMVMMRGVNQAGKLTARWWNEHGRAQPCSFDYQFKSESGYNQAVSYDAEISAICTIPSNVTHVSGSGRRRDSRFALHRARRICGGLLVIGLLLLTMRPAAAAQAPACVASPTYPAIAIPSPISIAPGASNGKIGQPSPPVTVSIDCYPAFQQTPNYYDDFTVQTGQLAALDLTTAPPGGGIMFQTSVPGIDVLLTAMPTQASSGNNGPNGTVGWAIGTSNCTSSGHHGNGSCSPNPISATFIAQLVKTGPVSPGTISSIQILQFFDSDFSPPPPRFSGLTNTVYTSASASYGTLTLNPVTVSMSTCSISASSKNISVILPTIGTNALQSTGSVTGQTAFSIEYSCPAGWALYMTMSTATPGAASGVILSPASCTSGASATNIGVQLLQSNQQPVQFDVAQPLGNSPNGILTIPYFAQYYATAAPVGAGAVCATATFTMSYQ
ncbi:MAG TPA: fimbrial protein [Rhodanobacter sp.]|nr:fimbrial protein [Rhodanobacter sp.]